MVYPQVVVDGGGIGFQIWRVAAHILNMQLWTTRRGGSPVWGLTTMHN